MIINHNMSAMYANRTLGNTQNELNKNIEKLSSGQRINKAGDDASGLAVSEKLRGQIRGLNQAQKNIENGVSFIQAGWGIHDLINETMAAAAKTHIAEKGGNPKIVTISAFGGD